SSVFHGIVEHRVLHAFPTRRSSDLDCGILFFVVFGIATVARLAREIVEEKADRLSQETTCRRAASVKRITAMSRCQSPYFGEERSEEHTSELQSRANLVCRLLRETK